MQLHFCFSAFVSTLEVAHLFLYLLIHSTWIMCTALAYHLILLALVDFAYKQSSAFP